jgi:hypothetical protein
MRTIIRNYSGHEEIEEAGTNFIEAIIICIFMAIIFRFTLFPQVPFLIIVSIFFILAGLSTFLDESITFDKGIKSVILEKRRVKWKETERIKFSDITMITVKELVDSDAGGIYYEISLTTVGGFSKDVLKRNREIDAKDFATRLCKITGANGYYIDDKKNSTPLIEAI